MATAQQITENQLNQHPKRFSRDRTVLSPGAIIPHESRREFQRLLEEYTAEFRPATEHQRYLVWQLADARFRIARMNRFEQCLWDINDDQRPCRTEDHRIVKDMMERGGGNIYDRIHRYRCAAERTYNKAVKELASFCKTTSANESGSFCKTNETSIDASGADAPQAKRAAPIGPSLGSFCKTEPPKPQQCTTTHETNATAEVQTSVASLPSAASSPVRLHSRPARW